MNRITQFKELIVSLKQREKTIEQRLNRLSKRDRFIALDACCVQEEQWRIAKARWFTTPITEHGAEELEIEYFLQKGKYISALERSLVMVSNTVHKEECDG